MKRKRFEGDPIEALRGADPLDRLDVPQDTTGAHARALFQEVTSMDTMEKTETVRTRPPARRRFALAASAAAVAVLVVASIAIFAGNDTPEDITVSPPAPVDTPDPVDDPIVGGEPIAAAAMCAVFYDLGTLADQEIAFDGTLASSDGDQVTFTVNSWCHGGSGGSVTPEAMVIAPGTITSAGPALEVGERYLVSGSGGNVWSCGFTMTYDTAIANQWATTFGS
jgi:hypothetical protein